MNFEILLGSVTHYNIPKKVSIGKNLDVLKREFVNFEQSKEI